MPMMRRINMAPSIAAGGGNRKGRRVDHADIIADFFEDTNVLIIGENS
jgi:hypothetical protein